MTSIRKTKKILKNSKDFLTVITKNDPLSAFLPHVLPLNENVCITFSKFCVIFNTIIGIPYEAVPYRSIKRVYVNK